MGPGGLAGAAPEDEASMEAAALIRAEALEAFELGACTIRTKEALVALEDGRNLTPEGNKRVLERWRLERENSDLELAEMQVLHHSSTTVEQHSGAQQHSGPPQCTLSIVVL